MVTKQGKAGDNPAFLIKMKNFLTTVLPDTGHYVGFALKNGKPYQQFFDTIDELVEFGITADRAGDVYYATSTFKTKESRKHDNVLLKKTFYLDIDCGEGKPYASQAEGMDALVKFLRETSLPKPTVVSSGRGLHVYWVLTEPVTPDNWLKVAHVLHSLTQQQGFNVDTVVTMDTARVLRLPNTTNKKNNSLSKVLTWGKQIGIIDFATSLRVNLHVANAYNFPCESAPAPRVSKVLENLQTEQEYPPSDSITIERKCAVIIDAVKNPNEVSEPLWYKIVGLAAYTSTPKETAIRWSIGHTGFNEEHTIRKMEQYKNSTSGAPLCASFANECKQCAKCKFNGKIQTPWTLGITRQEIKPEQSVLPLPTPYKRTKTGIYVIIDDVEVEVCDFDIYPVRYGKDESVGAETVHFKWHRQHVGWSDLIFPNHLLFPQSAREFVVQIGGQGVLLKSQAQTQLFQAMLKDYILELRKQAALTNIYNTMGWKEDKRVFVIGNTIFKRTDTGQVTEEVVTFNNGVNTSHVELFSTAGSLQEWVDFTAVLERIDLPLHQFALGVAFSAPLYYFTGLKGSVLSLYGETGGGKTLAQKWMQSIYGNPELLHYASNFTPNAVYHRMALLGCLPMTIDEATKMGNEFMGDFVYSVTQGRDKARLNKLAVETAPRTWALPVVLSTNISLASKLSSAGFASDAQMLRLFELELPVHKLFAENSDAGRAIHNFLMRNHGHAGRAYIKHLMSLGADKIQMDVDRALKEFPAKFGFSFTGMERYWEQLIVLAYQGLLYAKEAGLIKFSAETPIQAVAKTIGKTREVVNDNKRDIFDLIAAYCNEYSDCTVTAMYTEGNQTPTIDVTRLPRNSVFIRFNLYRRTPVAAFSQGVIILHQQHFRNWLNMQGVDYKTFINISDLQGVNVTPSGNKNRYCLGKGTSIRTGQVRTVHITMNHERLSSMLSDTDTDASEIQSNLKVVQ